MSSAQFNTYARFYDLLYRDKDYTKEATFIDQLISRFSSKPVSDLKLLDLACGTGRHLAELNSLGYKHLQGSDISTEMIEEARSSARNSGRGIIFHNHSFQEASEIKEKFDVVISMFSAFNYVTTFADQKKTLENIFGLLSSGGLLLFDYWNGNAVVRDYSPSKVLRKKNNDSEILRVSTTTIDTITQDVFVKFNCLYIEDSAIKNEFEEIHHLHYYHFSEMMNLLENAGFKVVHRCPFMEPDSSVNSHDWNISIVAQKP